jgi:3-oxoacyl-[acyl-carrier-protein] synthase II
MKRAVIDGIGVVGGFGCGLDELKQALQAGKSPRQSVRLLTGKGEVTVPALLADTAPLENYVSKKALRRLDHYTRLAVLGGFLALDDAGMRENRSGRMGIILATGYGATCNTADFAHSLAGGSDIFGSPTRFSNSVHNAAAAHLAILLGEKGPNLSLSQFDMSVVQAFLMALVWLSEERVDTVLVGGVDEYCNVLGHYWHTLYGDRAGFRQEKPVPAHAVIGEGAAFFVLSSPAKAPIRQGVIESVRLGRADRPLPVNDNRSPVILGADGYSDCLNRYPRFMPAVADIGVYTGIYGALPVGQAFDLAVAALSLAGRKMYPPVSPGEKFMAALGLSRRAAGLKTGRVHCVKLGSADDYGMVTVAVH